MTAVPYIGSKISLVSKSDLRYEGTLFTIDPANSTVSLSNVICFGTEQRLPEVTPGSDTVYPFLIFKGADIKNLYVIEDIEAAAQSRPSPPNDPAIIGTSSPLQSPNAAVIAAAKAKSEAEKADRLLAQQMSKAAISPSQERVFSHPAGFPPRPAVPAVQYRYGYQPQDAFYAPAGAPPYNPAYSGSYAPMPYPSIHYSANAAPADFRQPPSSSTPEANFRQPASMIKFAPQPPSQAQIQQAPSLIPNQLSSSERKPAMQQASSQAGFPTSKPPNSTSNVAYAGPGTAKYLESRHFKPATVKSAESSIKADEANAEAEFDFQSSNARFDKESFIRNLNSPRDVQHAIDVEAPQPQDPSSPKAVQPVAKKYDKAASFFDDISLDRDERGRRESRRGQNEETFGTIAAGYTASNYRRTFNRNRRGRPSTQSRQHDAPDGATASPQSPIRRTGQQSPRSRSSPRNVGKGRSRRGSRRGGSAPSTDQESRSRNVRPPTRQPASASNAPSA